MRKPIFLRRCAGQSRSVSVGQYVAPFLSPDDVLKVRYQDQELYITQVQGNPRLTMSACPPCTSPRDATSRVENQHRADVCVIGADIADKFFPHIQALDKQILVNDKPFTVIGVDFKSSIAFSWTNDGGNQNRASLCSRMNR